MAMTEAGPGGARTRLRSEERGTRSEEAEGGRKEE